MCQYHTKLYVVVVYTCCIYVCTCQLGLKGLHASVIWFLMNHHTRVVLDAVVTGHRAGLVDEVTETVNQLIVLLVDLQVLYK